MNHLIFEKVIIIFLLILCGFDTFRTRKRKRYDPAIEAADASERSGSVYRRAADSGFTEIEAAGRATGQNIWMTRMRSDNSGFHVGKG